MRTLRLICVTALLFTTPLPLLAAGYAVLEQSAEGIGTANSGGVTGYGDGSEAFLNPAALAKISQTQVSTSGHIIMAEAEFKNQNSTVNGLPNQGGSKDGGQTFFVPNFYVAQPVTEDIVLGFAFNAPFGLATEYGSEWAGRYQADKSELTILNFNGAVSYQVLDSLSIGISLGAIYADAELSNAIDFGSIGTGTLGLNTATGLGLLPQQADGHVVFDGEDWGLGWGIGALYTYGQRKKNRLGLSFRGPTDLSLHGGQAHFEVPANAAILQSTGAFTDSNVRAEATLPESLQGGIEHWVSETVALLYETQWTRWSRFDELRITYDNPAQADSVTEQRWKNSWRHAVGIKYEPDTPLDFRAGFAYDATPIASATYRTPRIPDADRYWIAAGIGYEITPDTRLDLSYAHIFVVDEKSSVVGPTGDTLSGTWDSKVDILSASLLWTFS